MDPVYCVYQSEKLWISLAHFSYGSWALALAFAFQFIVSQLLVTDKPYVAFRIDAIAQPMHDNVV